MTGQAGSGRLRGWLLSRLWVVGVALALALGGLFLSGHRSFFLPGATSDGHYLVEESCASCHRGFAAVANEDCVGCHQTELANDLHPVRTFEDPRWAADLEAINAVRCVTCHHEHRVAVGGVTVRREFCFPCHDDVVSKRPTHKDFSPASCGDAGCHNYHDHRGLDTAFLRASLGQPDLLPAYAVLSRPPTQKASGAAASPDAPGSVSSPPAVIAAWSASAHGAANVNCSDCHGKAENFTLRPSLEVCQSCHGFEVASFGAGKHGIKSRLGLPAVTTAEARLVMKPATDGAPHTQGCTACHDAHGVDTVKAATEACLGCHADRHSLDFAASPHAKASLGRDGRGGQVITCATCHLPRVEVEEKGRSRVAVQHNNSLTMRPVDRMARMVCNRCHGYELALASLLDPQKGNASFTSRPTSRPKSFSMVEAAAAAAPTQGGGR